MRLDSGAVPQTNLFEDGALRELEERRTAVFCPKTVTLENGNIPLVYATRKADRLLSAEDDNFFNLVGAIYSSDGEVLSGPIGFATNVRASFDVAVLGDSDVAIASDPKMDGELFVDPNDLNDDAILLESKAVSLERHKIKDMHTASATLVAHGESGFSLAFVKDEEVDIPGGPIAGTIDAFNRKEIKVLPVEESVETSTLGPVGVRDAVQIDFTRLENGNTVTLVDRDGEDGVRSKFDALAFIPGDAAIRTVQISCGARIFDVTVEALVGGGFVVV